MKIVSIAIQKGRAGKTTTAVNLAAGLRDRGQRCLLVDLDPQASLSQSLGIHDEPEPDIYHLLGQESSGEPAAPEGPFSNPTVSISFPPPEAGELRTGIG